MTESFTAICKKCGEDLTGKGIIAFVEHPCNNRTFEYKPMSDNEIRDASMEIGMPDIWFEAMDIAKPTEMERKIFQDNSTYEI